MQAKCRTQLVNKSLAQRVVVCSVAEPSAALEDALCMRKGAGEGERDKREERREAELCAAPLSPRRLCAAGTIGTFCLGDAFVRLPTPAPIPPPTMPPHPMPP